MPLDEWDPRRGRGGNPNWRRLVKELCPPGSMCEIPVCKMASRIIVFGLRRNHPLGPSLDHIEDLQYGGHPTARWNLRPAHFRLQCRQASAQAAGVQTIT